MSEVFHEIPEWLDGIRTIPKSGGWVFIRGWAPSIGLPGFCDELKINRMDIYWAFDEKAVTDPERFMKVNKHDHWLVDGYVCEGDTVPKEERAQAVRSFKHYASMINNPIHSRTDDSQLTVMQISHWSPQVVRFFNGEISYFSDEKLNGFLEAEAYIPIKFGEEEDSNIILRDTQQGIVDALMLDGLNRSEALKHVIDAGIVKNTQYPIPPYYYKLRKEYASYFSLTR